MDNKVVNYILIVIIVVILAYFFKSIIVQKSRVISNAAVNLLPGFDFIYV